MANAILDVSSNIENNSLTPSSVITLETAHSYVVEDLQIPLTGKIKTASPAFDGGGLTASSSAGFTNISTSNEDNGIKVQTKYLVNRADVLYNGTVSGWVSKSDNTVALAATNNTSATNGTAYYITGVIVPVDKPFTITTSADTALDSTSNVSITNAAYRQVVVDNNGTVAINSGSNSTGNLQVTAYSSSTSNSAENVQSVVENGVWKTYALKPTTSAQGPYYGKTSVAAVSQTNYSAGNIKHGVTITVKGGDTNIYSVAGTFTSDGTIEAAYVLKDKIGYSKGSKITGTMPNNGATGGTITTQNGTYTIPAGYTTGGTVTATFTAVSVSTPTWTKDSSTKIVTATKSQWSTGYITSGNLPAASFANSATSGTTYLDVSDGKKDSSTYFIPEVAANQKLYINRGYIDNICIDIGRLIPDVAAVNNLAGGYILSGHSAYDNAGNLIVGTITSLAATTYTPGTSDQTIAADQYLSGTQTIKGDADLVAANIKKGVEIFGVTGTFTTTPSGKTALTAAALRSGYAGFINGSQVNGSMATVTATPNFSNTGLDTYFDSGTSGDNSVSITPTYSNSVGYIEAHTDTAGTVSYYKIKTATFTNNGGNVTLVADTTSNSVYQSTTNTGNVSVESSAPTASSGYVYIKVTGSGTAKASAAGWIVINGATATGSSTKYIKMKKYQGELTVTSA